MEQLTLIYLILGGFSLFTLMIFIFVVAGRDMFFAFFRKFTRKYNDVFIVNPNKQLSHYYKKSKDGVFKIDGKMYITNPNKLLGLTDQMISEVQKSLSLGRKKLQKNIDKLSAKKELIIKQARALSDIPENVRTLNDLNMAMTELDNRIELLKSKLKDQDQGYWYNKRGAYFYIENDPVPKDFFELYTEMDSVQLENVIIRAQTKDPKSMGDIEKNILWIKRFVMFALIAGAIGAFFAFKNGSMLDQMGDKIGVAFKI